MKEIAFEVRTRFLGHYVSIFKDLNEEFLAGNSLSSFRNFEFEKENIFYSFSAEGISCGTVCDAIFQVLSTSDLFFDTIVYFKDGHFFDDIYDSALAKAKQQHNVVATHQQQPKKSKKRIHHSFPTKQKENVCAITAFICS